MADPMLEELCRQRYGHLVALATMLTGSRESAPDLVQEALIAVFGKRRSFPSLNAADAYVRRAISSRFVDGVRKSSRRRASESGFASQQPGAHLDVVGDDAELNALLAQLPPRVRACIVLCYVEDLPITETARALSLSEGSVKRYVHDGLQLLNGALGTTESVDDAPRVAVETRGAQR